MGQRSRTDVVPCGMGKPNDADDEWQYKAGEEEKLNLHVRAAEREAEKQWDK